MHASKNLSPRQAAILEAAMTAFSRYGFARTKMDDIAKASGVARTALYKTYRNKEHIFRALAEAVHDEALAIAAQELSSLGPFADRLVSAMINRDTHLLSVGHSGPHADEIAELYLSLASDLADQSNKALTDLISTATETAIESGGFELPSAFRSPADFALILRLGLEGVKKEIKTTSQFEALANQFIRSVL